MNMLTILQGDALEQLRTLPGESVHCCVTSPPYWGLRDYGTAEWEGGDRECDHTAPAGISGGQRADRTFTLGEIYKSKCGKCGAKRIDSQLGLEKTPEEYVAKMVAVFREVRRVLRKDGTCWVNLGDSYAQSGGTQQPEPLEILQERAKRKGYDVGARGAKTKDGQGIAGRAANTAVSGLKPKDMCGIPWRVVFALQADGWWLRSDIIWAKPNPMPESVTDRPTKAHEYLFLLTKSANYFYDAEAIKERASTVEERPFGIIRDREWGYDSKEAELRGRKPHPKYSGSNGTSWQGHSGNLKSDGTPISDGNRNKRSVWTVATAPYPEAHFATYPPDLIKPCILAGTSAKGCCAKCGSPWERVTEKLHSTRTRLRNGLGQDCEDGTKGRAGEVESKTIGWQPTCKCEPVGGDSDGLFYDSPIPCTVLDPFSGSGTTGAVALELGRKAILIELNPKYVDLILQRCDITPGLALA